MCRCWAICSGNDSYAETVFPKKVELFRSVLKGREDVFAHSDKGVYLPIIFMQCGLIRYNADAKVQMQNQSFQRLLDPRFTPFRPVKGEDLLFTKVAQQRAEDNYRNLFIVKDVIVH